MRAKRLVDANALGFIDHSRFGTLSAKLVFGKKPNGSTVHISEVVRGLACDCICPACEVPLVANKGRKKQHHFKHHVGDGCGYGPETNAHNFAKRLLERDRWITLPERTATFDGVTRVMRPQERFEFDDVIVEPRLGQVIPDLIAIADGTKLLIEVYVTHRCGDEKIARIRQMGLSAIEVDLSAYRTSLDDDAIAAGFLYDAPRGWLHNRLAESDQTRLRLENARRQREKDASSERRVRGILDAIRATNIESERLASAISTVNALGLGKHIGIGQPAAGFSVPTAEWQALFLMRMVILPSREGSWGFTITPTVALAHVAECIIPELREPLPPDVEASLSKWASNLVLPLKAIASYVAYLVEAKVLEPSTLYDRQSAKVASAEIVDLRRRISDYLAGEKNERDAERRLQFVLDQLNRGENDAFDLDVWKTEVPGFNLSLSELCANGDAWQRFSAALFRIETMLRGGRPATELLGLPLEKLRTAAVEAAEIKRKEDARRAEEALEAARKQRVANIQHVAQKELRSGANDWLNRPNRLGLTPLEAAAEGLSQTRLYNEIYELGERRRQSVRAERIIENLRERLRADAFVAFGRNQLRANLFLNSSQPTLKGQSPLAYCQNEASLAHCLSLMARQSRPNR